MTQEKMPDVAHEVLALLKALKLNGETKSAMVLGLSGDLGAGKTTFSQQVAKVLGIEEKVTSPTFVIEKVYHTKDTAFPQFIHIDAYRLDTGSELSVLGFEKLLGDPNNLIFIEWPERVADVLPKDTIMLRFTVIDELTRQIEMSPNSNSDHGNKNDSK